MENQNPPIQQPNVAAEQLQAPIPPIPKTRNWLRFIMIVLVVLVIASLGVGTYFLNSDRNTTKTAAQITPTATLTPTPTSAPVSILSDKEKAQIDMWITKNDLNTYGDPKTTTYLNGDPLNGSMGERLDKYTYVAEKHSDSPWCTPRPACLDATPRCMIAETADMCPKKEISVKIDPLLVQLIGAPDRTAFAKLYAHQLVVSSDKVQAYLTVSNENYKLNAEFGAEETRNKNIIQAEVFIDKLTQLANDPSILSIKPPQYGITQ